MDDLNNDVSINGNMDGNIIIGDGNQITVSSDSKTDKIASEMAIKRLQKEISDIRNADNEIFELKRKYYSDNLSTASGAIQKGVALVLADLRKEKPSSFLKSLNGTGFTDKKINATLGTLTVQEMEAIKNFYTKEFLNIFKNGPSPAMKQAVDGIIKDMERLIEIEKSKILLPQKAEELKKHRKIVENL